MHGPVHDATDRPLVLPYSPALQLLHPEVLLLYVPAKHWSDIRGNSNNNNHVQTHSICFGVLIPRTITWHFAAQDPLFVPGMVSPTSTPVRNCSPVHTARCTAT